MPTAPTAIKTVKIYSTPTCHFCHMAKDFMRERGVAFEDINVDQNNLENRRELFDLMGGVTGVPVIVAGSEKIVGFDPEKLSAALGI
jgi:glutaredoxin 3